MSEKKVVHIPADIHQRLRIKAAQRNTTVRALVIEAVTALLAPAKKTA
jgi:hypothetical protein